MYFFPNTVMKYHNVSNVALGEKTEMKTVVKEDISKK